MIKDLIHILKSVFIVTKLFQVFIFKNEISICLYKARAVYTFEHVMTAVGIDKTQASRYLASYDRYIADNKLQDIYSPFSKSALFEMITVPLEILNEDIQTKVLRPEMSVKTVREYVKNYNNRFAALPEQTEFKISEDEIKEVEKLQKATYEN